MIPVIVYLTVMAISALKIVNESIILAKSATAMIMLLPQ